MLCCSVIVFQSLFADQLGLSVLRCENSSNLIAMLYCVLVFVYCDEHVPLSWVWCVVINCLPPSFIMSRFLSTMVWIVVCLPLCFAVFRFLSAIVCALLSLIYCGVVVDLLPYFIVYWFLSIMTSVFCCVPVLVYCGTRFIEFGSGFCLLWYALHQVWLIVVKLLVYYYALLCSSLY